MSHVAKKLMTASPSTERDMKCHVTYFCMAYDNAGKADLSKGYLNPKRKVWVTTVCMHFSEIMKQQ